MYLEKIKNLSFDNKYTKWYCNIIITALNRNLEGYGEKHHILPRSFNMGGEKDKLNLVLLTAKEHYLCHQLLTRMIVDKELLKKCYLAAFYMSKTLGLKSSRLYEKNKLVVAEISSEMMTNFWQDSEFRAKQALATETKYTPEVRRHMSNVTKELLKDPNYYTNAVETLKKAHENIDHTTKEWTARSFNSEESLRKSKEYSQTAENKKNCSERELSKGKEALSTRGKEMRQAQRTSFGSEEAYQLYLTNINKGRKRIVNLATLEVKQIKDSALPEGWKFWSDIDEQTKKLFVRKKPDYSNAPKKNWYHNPNIQGRPIKVLVGDIPPIGFIPGRGPQELWSINNYLES